MGDQDLGKGVSDSSTLGYNRAIRSTCWLVSKFEDEELLPAAMLLFVQAIASRGSAKEPGKLPGSAGPRTFKRVSMGLTDRRKAAKNLVESCKN